MAKKKRRSRSSAPKTGCKSGIVRFRSKRGKIIEFKGKQGPACGPRRKPTPPPKRFRDAFARQARACKGSSHGAFIKCMKRLRGAIAA
jgi:hypothetical protein